MSKTPVRYEQLGCFSYLFEAEWRIGASVKHTIIDSDNGLSPDRRQAIIRTNSAKLSIRP